MSNIAQLANQMDAVTKELDTIANNIGNSQFNVGGYSISKDVSIGDLFKVGQISAKSPQKVDAFQIAPDKEKQIESKMASKILQG